MQHSVSKATGVCLKHLLNQWRHHAIARASSPGGRAYHMFAWRYHSHRVDAHSEHKPTINNSKCSVSEFLLVGGVITPLHGLAAQGMPTKHCMVVSFLSAVVSGVTMPLQILRGAMYRITTSSVTIYGHPFMYCCCTCLVVSSRQTCHC